MTSLSTPPEDQAIITSVAPGLTSARLPLPFALDHVHVWLLEEADGWTVIDTGVSSNRTRLLWDGIIERHFNQRLLRRLIATHYHPDHVGLADWLCQRFDAPLMMTQTEWLLARLLSQDQSSSLQAAYHSFYRAMGLDDAATAQLLERGNAYARGVPSVPAQFRRLKQGDQLEMGGYVWQVITSGGHSPEHACFYAEKGRLLIAGDMVLPRISPNVSVWPLEPDADPLRDFLDGLSRLRQLPEDTLVLPSHGQPFQHLHQRIDELTHHHAERLMETEVDCRTNPRTVAEVTRTLFRRPLDTHQLSFATGEALAHLNHLVSQGKLKRSLRDDGVWLFGT